MAAVAEAEGNSLDILTPEVFLPLLRPARFKGVHGGRGSGKSHTLAEMLIELAYMEPPLNAVCLREIQNDLDQSVKKLLESKIAKFGLDNDFRILEKRIITPGGGLIIFRGMNDFTADSIKSLEGYRIAWVEEAQTLSARSLEVLRPTLRITGSELWFSWNPRKESDPVNHFFRGNVAEEYADQMIVVEANWRDNPFLTPELKIERRMDYANNPDRYAHIWEGEYEPQAVGAIFHRQTFDKYRKASLAAVEAEVDIERIVVSVDHATSSADGSDEHGIIVAGRGSDERGYAIEDASLRGTPETWARRVVEKFDQYNADAIVIERNQGGDLVRRTLEAERVGLPIIEVVATRGKHVRAEPIASRVAKGQVTHVGPMKELEDQLVLITASGYEGEGSPDRADAYVWALTELFPTMGAGKIWDVAEADIIVAPFRIPPHWPRGFAIDTDPHGAGIIWGAIDPVTTDLYIFGEYTQRGSSDIPSQARAISTRGAWMRGGINPVANKRKKVDAEGILTDYAAEGVYLTPRPDDVEGSITAVMDRMTTGRLKVFSTCQKWFREFRVYHRDDDKRPVNTNAKLMNATRLWVSHAKAISRVQPAGNGQMTTLGPADPRAGY